MTPGAAPRLPLAIAQELAAALRGLRYGSIQLVIHDEKIVRIERIERIHLPAPARVVSQNEAAGTQAGLTDFSEALPTRPGSPTPSPEGCRHEL